ncbi:MAG: hypothetical protein KIT84_00555 [Labilithrix sp.]|nr:hypothetical protein [Labilithrix sp.]MCW5809474.1 hypothetical protein [Labilithrix sp.]
MSGVGDALVDVVLDGARDGRVNRVRRLLGWAARLTNPPVGVRLVSDDGGSFTGFVIVEHNKPIAMLAIRVGTAPPRHQMTSTEPGYFRPVHGEPRWPADDDLSP